MPDNAIYVAMDFETSAPKGERACAIGMSRLEGGKITGEYYSLIRPPSSRVWYTRVHGITWRQLRDQRPFAEVWPEIFQFIAGADYLVAHNARFDRNVLSDCCAANTIPMPPQPFLCTLKGSRRSLRLQRYSLDTIAAHLGIPLDHHHAGSDARACCLVLASLLDGGLANSAMLLT